MSEKIAQLQQAILLNPNDVETHYNLGVFLKR
ncbi:MULTISPECIES: tetratricopeptide repeat protein [Nostocales]|uniref:Tetratricopeptide repeat protein n=2 Tax=Nostocales TaxID=1161 RepID=A0A8S9T5E0_9CYAN|nr:tetratricopeptide repeat protein [Tolypothrix bouteillei VB521301]